MIFTIEGSIGVGKSTLLAQLSTNVSFSKKHIVVLEPVDDWMKFKANPEDAESLFEMYYKDPTKYGFSFQMMALQTRFENLISMTQGTDANTIIICERSFLTDYQIFAKMLWRKKFITDIEMAVYKRWHAFILDLIKPKIMGTIYLRAPPDVCAKRINTRNRKGEEDLDADYLKDLHEAHDDWLLPTDSLIIDASGASIDLSAIVKYVEERLHACIGPVRGL